MTKQKTINILLELIKQEDNFINRNKLQEAIFLLSSKRDKIKNSVKRLHLFTCKNCGLKREVELMIDEGVFVKCECGSKMRED